MIRLDLLKGIWAISICVWGLIGVLMSFRVQWFIVKRYEKETNLLDTVIFREHVTFIRDIPRFLATAIYTSHLLICLWGWRFYGRKKVFRDIKSPELITRLFSKKELRLAKLNAIIGIIVIIHAIAFYFFQGIWPDVFG